MFEGIAGRIYQLSLFVALCCANGFVEFDVTTKTSRHMPAGYRSNMRYSHKQHVDLMVAPNKDMSLFYITVMISDHKVPVNVMLDTGSSVLWVFESSCLNVFRTQFCGVEQGPIDYGYLDGSLSGNMIKTNVYLTDSIFSKDSFVMLTTRSDEQVKEPMLGLAESTTGYATFIDKLKENGIITEREYSIDFKSNKFIVGRKEAASQLVVCPIVTFGYNEIALDAFLVHDEYIINNRVTSLIDSGNTLIAIPMIYWPAISDILKKRGVNCTLEVEDNPMFENMMCETKNKDLFGTFTFVLNEVDFVLDENDLIDSCTTNADLSYKCKTTIEFHTVDFSIILGQPFLKKFTARFNMDRKEISFEISGSAAIVEESSL